MVVNTTVSENQSKELVEAVNIITLTSEAMDDNKTTGTEINTIHLNSPSISNNYIHDTINNPLVSGSNKATRPYTNTIDSNIWLTVATATTKRERKHKTSKTH